MKFRRYAFLTLLLAIGSTTAVAQQDIIDRVFSNKPVDYRNQLVLEDTLAQGFFYASTLDGYSYSYTFGHDDFQNFLSYRNKLTGKRGIIVLGTNVSAYSEASADSVYFMQTTDNAVTEGYDDMGNYTFTSHATAAQFYFDQAEGQDELWTVTTEGGSYKVQKTGTIQKDLFKAVSFTESVSEEGYSQITALYANIRTNKVYKSAVLNEKVTVNEVYAYHYDYYGEYDYYYGYEMPETDYSVPTFESRLNYEPIEIAYTMSGDTIGEVFFYTYPGSDLNAFNHKAVPDEYSGVWKAQDESMLIIDGDDMWSAYGVFMATIDSYKNLYQVSKLNWNDAISKLNLSAETQKQLEAGWKGSKSDLRFISLTSWTVLGRFKDVYLANGEIMAHIYLEAADAEGNVSANVEFLTPQKVHEALGYAYYDNYSYTTVLRDLQGNPVDLVSAGVDYYYNYNMAVADRNLDKDGNLVLTNESLGSINFKSYSGGSNYIGQVRYQWIGDANFNNGARVVGIKSMPYKIVDESGKIIADDIFSMYVTNVQGFNLYQIFNSNNKCGVLGPDGNWMIKQEWENVTVLGPSSSYGYDGYGSIGLPVFFSVMKGDKYGVLDSKGNWVVPMGYEYVEVCQNQILATRGGKLTVYSFDGKALIENIDGFMGGYYGYATDCYSFDQTSMGSRVLIKDQKFGIVDKNFNVTVPFAYSSISPVAGSNKFIVADEEGKYGMINEKGTTILPSEYDLIIPFDYYPNRLVASKDGKQGVINENGKVLIPFEFYSISTGSDWVSNMIYISDPDYRTNIVDTTGKSIIDGGCTYVYYYPTQELFYCSGADGKFTFYDKSGSELYSKIVTYIDPYSAYDYVQIAQMGDYETPLYGAFDLSSGAELMPYNFESLYPFWIDDQIFFAGTVKGKLGIYSIDGKTLVKPKGAYLDNYYYESGEYGGEAGYYVEISNKKGKSKLIRLEW